MSGLHARPVSSSGELGARSLLSEDLAAGAGPFPDEKQNARILAALDL